LISLGIDQSFTSTGWFVSNSDLYQYGLIHSDKNLDTYTRAIGVADEIMSLLMRRLNGDVDVVTIEGLPFMSRSNVTRDLAGLQFLIIDRLMDKGYVLDKNLFIIPPTTLKKYATGKGNIKGKEPLYEALPDGIRSSIGKIPKSKGRSDITDAYWLSKIGEERANECKHSDI